jgi:hypothetical protein
MRAFVRWWPPASSPQGVPVSAVKRREGPHEAIFRQTVRDLAIVFYENVVVVIDEIEGLDRPIEDDRHRRQKQTEEQHRAQTLIFH